MALMPIKGRVAWIFTEENFDVDQIVGVKNIKITDIGELSKLAMQSYDPAFATDVKAGDVVVGAGNFGYGHPHYPPLRALRHLGISAVIAAFSAVLIPAIGSSSSTSRAFCIRARANSTCFCFPYGISPGSRPAVSGIPRNSSTSVAAATAARCSARARGVRNAPCSRPELPWR